MVPGSSAVRRAQIREHESLVQKGPLHDSWGSENVGSTDGDREENSLVKDNVQDRTHLPEALVLLAGAHELKGIAGAPGSTRGILEAHVAVVDEQGWSPRKEGRV
jgi:hypothetical protein